MNEGPFTKKFVNIIVAAEVGQDAGNFHGAVQIILNRTRNGITLEEALRDIWKIASAQVNEE